MGHVSGKVDAHFYLEKDAVLCRAARKRHLSSPLPVIEDSTTSVRDIRVALCFYTRWADMYFILSFFPPVDCGASLPPRWMHSCSDTCLFFLFFSLISVLLSPHFLTIDRHCERWLNATHYAPPHTSRYSTMSASSFAAAQSLLTYSLVLPQSNPSRMQEADDAAEKGNGSRLYFASTANQHDGQHHSLRQSAPLDPSAAVALIRDGIATVEQRECGLHHVRLAPSFVILTAGSTAEPDTVLYAERVDTAAVDHTENACEAVLSSCPQVFEDAMKPDQSYNAAAVAPLCIFHSVCNSCDGCFWTFLAGVLRHGLCEGTSAAAVAAVRGRLLPAHESTNTTDATSADAASGAFCLDAFAEAEGEGETAGATLSIDTSDAVDAAITHLQGMLARTEQRHGCSLLVLDVTWRRLKQQRQPTSPLLSPLQAPTEKEMCVVWLRNPPLTPPGDENDGSGVYADAALEMLLDELVLAAATARSPLDAKAVLEEPGVQQFFRSCTLTRELKGVLQTQFVELSSSHRPLFHWMVCAPPSSTRWLKGGVVRRTFTTLLAEDASDDFWCAMEEVEHWKEVTGAVAALHHATAPLVPAYASSPVDAAELETSLLGLSGSLREKTRVSRQRRAIRQSGHQPQSTSHDGSVLSRQRRKLNVPKLYGFEEGQKSAVRGGSASLETSLGSSGVFHRTRSSPNTSISGASLLEAEETLGRSTRRTARLVKRIPKTNANANAGT